MLFLFLPLAVLLAEGALSDTVVLVQSGDCVAVRSVAALAAQCDTTDVPLDALPKDVIHVSLLAAPQIIGLVPVGERFCL